MSEGPDVTPEDALQVAQRALAKVGDLEDELHALQADYEQTREDLTAVELRLSEHDDETAYRDLTLNDKVGMVREHAYRKAADGHGVTTLDYDDVMWEVFDGEPGTKHCYKLLRLAAGTDETARRRLDRDMVGFAIRDPANGNFCLKVDAAKARRSAAFCSENKAATEGGR